MKGTKSLVGPDAFNTETPDHSESTDCQGRPDQKAGPLQSIDEVIVASEEAAASDEHENRTSTVVFSSRRGES
jgi:hypothetical protein